MTDKGSRNDRVGGQVQTIPPTAQGRNLGPVREVWRPGPGTAGGRAEEGYLPAPGKGGTSAFVPSPPRPLATPAPATQHPIEMKVSDAGKSFVKMWETGDGKPRLGVYTNDGAGNPTIGFGHLLVNGESYPSGITPEQAEAMFEQDLEKHADIVRQTVDVPLTQPQFDALVSLTFNAPSALTKPSGFRARLNSQNYAGAGDRILLYNKGRNPKTGDLEVIDGLNNRRAAEREMFVNGNYDSRH